MPAEVANGIVESVTYQNGDLKSQNPSNAAKKSRETDRRRRRRKQKKNSKATQSAAGGYDSGTDAEEANTDAHEDSKENSDPLKVLPLVEVEYVPERAELDGELSEEFRKVFEKFNFKESAVSELQRRMKIAELKQLSSRPYVVEVWDATSADPKLLVYLKSYRNTVAVPRHWCQKRKFLQDSSTDNSGTSTWKARYRKTSLSASQELRK